MSRSLRILGVARTDIEQIFDWLEKRSPQGAVNWYRALLGAVDRIASDPERHAVAPEATARWKRRIHQLQFRTARGNRYRIVFEITDTEILILRIRGSGQPPLRHGDLPTV